MIFLKYKVTHVNLKNLIKKFGCILLNFLKNENQTCQ